ncbi:MAG: hypothetical protein IJ569_01360 [Prevotella sp.]|nr:hypothetical protein [Prevotella sp.]
MNYNHPNRYSSTVSIRLMCAIVFLLFSFVWLYCFQADLMAAAQYVLSGGITHYQRLLATVIIMTCLQLLQLIIYAAAKLRKRSHALTYLPSMLVLAMITDISQDIDVNFSWGAWWWAFPLVIVVWLIVVVLARGLQDIEPDNESCGLFSRAMWINMLTMALLIIGVALISNTNAVFHYRMKAEALLLDGRPELALRVGEKSLESDANLQMVRMFALSQTGHLGERLFHYPVVAGSSAMLPTNGESRTTLLPVDSIYRYFGARPASVMSPERYLKAVVRRDSSVAGIAADYELCGLLIDKQIDEFVTRLCQQYSIDEPQTLDRLPRHYREALTLYTHLRSNPRIVYHNAVMEEDFDNLQELESKYPDLNERKGRVEEQYNGTYWYYYEYQ